MTATFREKRKDVARHMIPYLEAVSQEEWRNLVTGDESRFFLAVASPNVVGSQR
jgi:hypothetical protein